MKRFLFLLLLLILLIFLAFNLKSWILPYWYLPSDSNANSGIHLDDYEVVTTKLKIPWDIAFLPDGDLLVTEREGRLVRLGKIKQTIPIQSTLSLEEGGLLGIALHPEFEKNHWVYLYNTVKENGRTLNRVERYRYDNDSLKDQKIIIDHIPGAKYHDGGRIAFGPDGYLYITTGDASREHLAQDLSSLAGKILRLKEDGSIPPDNPFGNAIYSYGHRNPQGLTWDSSQQLWSTEHGPQGFDELNLIEKGKNYGWPMITGSEAKAGMEPPKLHSGRNETWAPASALYWDGSIFFGGLRGVALYEAKIEKDNIELKEHFKGELGRVRTVVLGPDGFFYITTSNRDGRGFPQEDDDKIIKINPKIFRELPSQN